MKIETLEEAIKELSREIDVYKEMLRLIDIPSSRHLLNKEIRKKIIRLHRMIRAVNEMKKKTLKGEKGHDEEKPTPKGKGPAPTRYRDCQGPEKESSR